MALKDIIKEYGAYALPGGIWHGLRNIHNVFSLPDLRGAVPAPLAAEIEKEFSDSVSRDRYLLARIAPKSEALRDVVTALLFGINYLNNNLNMSTATYPIIAYVGITIAGGMCMHSMVKKDIVSSLRLAYSQCLEEILNRHGGRINRSQIDRFTESPAGRELFDKSQAHLSF